MEYLIVSLIIFVGIGFLFFDLLKKFRYINELKNQTGKEE